MKLIRTLISFSGILISVSLSAQLTINAGNNTTICPGATSTLGGTPTATGGTPPYTYSWVPNINISSTTTSNPIANPQQPMWYFLTVSDAAGNTALDSVFIDLDPLYAYNAGNDTSICIGSSVMLGSPNNSFTGGVTYQWAPSTALDNANAPRPVSTTTTTITYSVIITSPNCPSKSYDVKVTVNPLPVIDVCCPTTINEGDAVVVTATGGVLYSWVPGNTVSNPTTGTTTAEPTQTTTYLVYGIDANNCFSWDTVTITVIPSSELVFYNTFSPNGDGVNDHFYIGNVAKYPECRLEVYTRTGQLVYAKTAYDNSWDGTNYGDRLPEATYYYSFNPGDGSATVFGYITIVR